MTKGLVLCDDRWHPRRTVEAGTAAIVDRGFSFEYSDGSGDRALDGLGGYHVVMLAKSNNRSASDERAWITEAKARALSAFVASGGGLAVVHSGISGYGDSQVMRNLLGSGFLRHPEQCPVSLSIVAAHEVVEGVQPFEALDEHYYAELFDPAAEVVAESSAGGVRQPAVWVASRGSGRICTITPGHNLDVWLQPSFERLLANALRWCARQG
jgi:Uncharacterized protein conserved in bacteria